MEFLRSVTAEEARSIIAELPLAPPQAAAEPLDAALGRVLAGDVVAGEDIPPFSRSLVDGYAVKAKDTYGARESTPSFLIVRGEVRVGQAAEVAVSDGDAVYIATGAMIPDGADGVVMEEYTRVA
jgi:molybdopterin molybdotransferase